LSRFDEMEGEFRKAMWYGYGELKGLGWYLERMRQDISREERRSMVDDLKEEIRKCFEDVVYSEIRKRVINRLNFVDMLEAHCEELYEKIYAVRNNREKMEAFLSGLREYMDTYALISEELLNDKNRWVREAVKGVIRYLVERALPFWKHQAERNVICKDLYRLVWGRNDSPVVLIPGGKDRKIAGESFENLIKEMVEVRSVGLHADPVSLYIVSWDIGAPLYTLYSIHRLGELPENPFFYVDYRFMEKWNEGVSQPEVQEKEGGDDENLHG
ncbi:hypothetical protein DRQ18_06830, partial [bacterium]